jgi:hypothetical protein
LYYSKTQQAMTHITEITPTLKQNTAHRTTQAIKDTYNAMYSSKTEQTFRRNTSPLSSGFKSKLSKLQARSMVVAGRNIL